MGRTVDVDGCRAVLLVALVRFHPWRHLVLVVDLDGSYLVALDSAFGVDEGDVVMLPGAVESANDLGGPRTVALYTDDDLVVGGRRRRRNEQAGHRDQHRDGSGQMLLHKL